MACSSGTVGPNEGDSSNEVLIGSIWPITGSGAESGLNCTKGVQLAQKHINEQGGIKSLNGAKIKLIEADAQSDPSITAAEAERILGNYKVSAMIGCQASALTLKASDVTERYEVPLVTFSLSDQLISRGFRYTFQHMLPASEWGVYPVQLVQTLIEMYKKPDPIVGIAFEDSAYGAATAEGLENKAKELGQNVVLVEPYRSGFTDASPLVQKIKTSGCKVLYLAAYLTDAVLIQRTLKEQNVNVTIVGTGVGHSMLQFGEMLGELANYVLVSEGDHPGMKVEGLDKVSADFKDTFGKEMDPVALNAYVSLWIVKEGLEKAASSDPKNVRDAISSLDLSSGPAVYTMSGKLKYDETGRNIHAGAGMLQWFDGRLEVVWPEKIASKKIVWPAPTWSER